jgi:hypothetical protein
MPVTPNGLWVKRSSKAQLSWLNIEFRAAVHAVWLARSPATGLSRKTHLTRIYSSVGSHIFIEISNSGNGIDENPHAVEEMCLAICVIGASPGSRPRRVRRANCCRRSRLVLRLHTDGI